jgi:hypothetical protein
MKKLVVGFVATAMVVGCAQEQHSDLDILAHYSAKEINEQRPINLSYAPESNTPLFIYNASSECNAIKCVGGRVSVSFNYHVESGVFGSMLVGEFVRTIADRVDMDTRNGLNGSGIELHAPYPYPLPTNFELVNEKFRIKLKPGEKAIYKAKDGSLFELIIMSDK